MVIKSKQISTKKLQELKEKVKKRKSNLQLEILYIEKNKASEIFIKEKVKIGKEIGVKVNVHTFKKDVLFEILKVTCNNLNFNPNTTGYLIQLPIEQRLLDQNILDSIDPSKDVDCLSSTNLGRALKNIKGAIRPATVEAILTILRKTRVRLKSKHITIINDSNLIGKPLSACLLSRGATVSVCNEFTKDISSFTQDANIIISATGQPNLIKSDMISKNCIIIDVGSSIKGGKVYGDVDFKNVSKKAKVITPVPGGVGPLTVACLFENLVNLHKTQIQ